MWVVIVILVVLGLCFPAFGGFEVLCLMIYGAGRLVWQGASEADWILIFQIDAIIVGVIVGIIALSFLGSFLMDRREKRRKLKLEEKEEV